MNETTARLNPDLDIQRLSEEFGQRGRIRISDVLVDAFATKTLKSLQGDMPWQLMYFNHEGKGTDMVGRLSPQQQARMSESQKQALADRIHADAAHRYQSWYKGYDILMARREGREQHLYLQKFLDFMGSDELFEFIEAVSGDRQFNRVDCHACRYEPGHFLREHSDQSPFENRRLAYVFNFSPNWEADFGGLTHFMDDDHQLADTYVPEYNSLLLFRVPVNNSVSMVANYAPRARYSITGWFTRYD